MVRAAATSGARCPERGVTTAEALIAGMILGLGLLVVTRVMISSTRASSAADHQTVAARIAASQIGELRSLDDDHLGIDLSDPDAVTSFEGLTTVTAAQSPLDPVIATAVDGTTYSIRRHVLWAPVGADPQAYRRLVVVVSWTEADRLFDHRLDSGTFPLIAP